MTSRRVGITVVREIERYVEVELKAGDGGAVPSPEELQEFHEDGRLWVDLDAGVATAFSGGAQKVIGRVVWRESEEDDGGIVADVYELDD